MHDSSWWVRRCGGCAEIREPETNIHEDKDGTRPHVEAFLQEGKRQGVDVKRRVALLPEPKIVKSFDLVTGDKKAEASDEAIDEDSDS